MRELYIVYEDYMGRKDIIGIFKEIENAKYYQENYSKFCYVKKVITDIEFNEVLL